jgi:hypothetical protein
MGDEQRHASRISTSYAVRYRKGPDDQYETGPVANLSPGGFFITTQALYSVGQAVEVQVTVSNGLILAQGRARVAHVEPARGMGFEFTEIDDRLASFLRDVVERRVKDGA